MIWLNLLHQNTPNQVSFIYKQMGRHKAPICLALIVILLWQCMMRKAMDHPFKILIWKGFRDDVIALWIHSNEDENHYLDYFNTIDALGKIRFTIETETENGLEFLDLRLKLKGCNKITVDVYTKPTNRFTYVDPKTCYPSRNLIKIPEGIVLRLRCIFDSDEKYEKRSNKHQNYLIARNYSPSLVV